MVKTTDARSKKETKTEAFEHAQEIIPFLENIDEAHEARSVVLKDHSTSEKYKVFVDNGKLTMAESEE